MKNLFTTLLILLLILPLGLHAQAPGYIGKRASLMLNFSSFPAIAGPTKNNRGSSGRVFGEGEGRFGFNCEFEGQFSYALGRYFSLGIVGGQYATGTTSNADTFSEISNPQNYYLDHHEMFHRLNVRSLGLMYSTFNKGKGGLAPIGNRFFMSVKRYFINSEIIYQDTYYANSSAAALGHGDLGIDESLNLTFFHIGWSNDMVLWDKVIFSAGFKLGAPLNLKFYDSLTEEDSLSYFGDNPDENQYKYEAAVFNRLVRHELFRIDFGIGYLLF